MSDNAPSAKRQKTEEPGTQPQQKVCSTLHVHFWVWDAIVRGHKVMEYRDQAVWDSTFLTDPIPYTHIKLWRAYTCTYALVRIGRVHSYTIPPNTCFQAGPYNNNPSHVLPFPCVRKLLCIPLLQVLHVGVHKNK